MGLEDVKGCVGRRRGSIFGQHGRILSDTVTEGLQKGRIRVSISAEDGRRREVIGWGIQSQSTVDYHVLQYSAL